MEAMASISSILCIAASPLGGVVAERLKAPPLNSSSDCSREYGIGIPALNHCFIIIKKTVHTYRKEKGLALVGLAVRLSSIMKAALVRKKKKKKNPIDFKNSQWKPFALCKMKMALPSQR